jgi:large subunit ribosomal protein L7/L12
MADITKEQLIEFIKSMTVLELSELVKELEEVFGVSASAPMMAAMPAMGGGEAVEEQTEFDVILSSFGEKKIQVVKEVRNITGLGLKESKELVDNVPNPIKEGIPMAEAEEIKGKIEEVGGSVEIK